jgi:xylulokinase
VRHHRTALRRADLFGHLNSFLHRQFTGQRVIDPSNASFTGLYMTVSQRGWSDELADVIGVRLRQLPQIKGANEIGGHLRADAARALGLRQGTPMLVGCVDTSAAMLLAGAEPGRLLEVAGSTDVLALCTDKPRPHERLLTRALGVGPLWMSVSTIAAAGSSLTWMHEQMFPDLSQAAFYRLVGKLADERDSAGVTFDPYLAGDRTSLQQPRGAFAGLTLATTRCHLLAAVIDALARASAARVDFLRKVNRVRIDRDVIISGGAGKLMPKLLRRDWRGAWSFRVARDATLRGLALLARR